jgi:hypothetical protein
MLLPRAGLVAALVAALVPASSGLVATTTGGLPPLPTGQQLQLATLDFDDAGVGGYARQGSNPRRADSMQVCYSHV